VIVANEQPPAAPAFAKAQADRPVLKLKAKGPSNIYIPYLSYRARQRASTWRSGRGLSV
jgi:hypothetical protein